MSASSNGFDSGRLLACLERLPTPGRYWVGYSGGADSTALLLAMHECRDRLPSAFSAVHFHHGLQAEADAWLTHCRSFCVERNIPFIAQKLRIDSTGRCSTEEAARNSRYSAVSQLLGQREMYLTAHHQEDLAETLFLNLMRGSGVEGLAGIPVLRDLEGGWVARPLLEMHRRDLESYLRDRGIDWLTDPSNTDTAFDRNYLRVELFPRLEKRWPGLVQRLSRTARNARITANAMAAFIESQCGELLQDPFKMPLPQLLELDSEMQSLIVRQWLRRHEVPPLPEQRIREFLKQLSTADTESQAEVRWAGWLIKHYRFSLWLHRGRPLALCPSTPWHKSMELELGADSGRLVLRGGTTSIPGGWLVRARAKGDRIRMRPYGANHKLKHLFQSAGIPPWLRRCVPVLEWEGEPVALGDWALAHRLREWLAEHGLDYVWEPSDPLLARLRSDLREGAVDRNPPLG